MSNSVTTHLRSSEKSMIASCPFSDEVANCAIQAYKQHVPQFLQDSLKQTVLAAFVLCDERPSTQKISKLQTISFGVGTKFLNLDGNLGQSLTVVRDLHAEVLARKALQFWLVHELEKSSSSKSNNQGGQSSCLEQVTLVSSGDGDDVAKETEIHLAAKCSLHFYTSSTPCGNSAVRRWATGTSSRARESGNNTTTSNDLELDSPSSPVSWIDVVSPKNNETKIPEVLPHDPLHVVQRDAGQVALLCRHHQINGKNQGNDGNVLFPPNGTCLNKDKNEEKIPCCSGKIAAWNFLKCWEGLLLRKMFSISNIVPSTIVVGRKFSQVHCQRALCCRVDLSTQILSKKEKKMDREFRLLRENAGASPGVESCDEVELKIVTGERRRQRIGQEIDDGGNDERTHSQIQQQHQQVHHPVLLSTSIKFDNSVKNVEENEGANFGESKCFWWSSLSSSSSPGVSEILCGKTGKKIVTKQQQDNDGDGSVEEELAESLLSTHSFVNSVMMKKDGSESDDLGRFFLEKIVADDVQLQNLVNHPLLFPNWPRCDLLDSFL